MNNLYPIFLKLSGEKVLIVGGGTVAEQKLNSLLGTGAKVTVISLDVSEGVRTLLKRHGFSLLKRAYRTGDAEGFSMVFGATDDPAVQNQIYRDGRSKNIPVNIVDVPDLCTFYLPSVFQKGDLKIAVSTNGKSPTLGKFIRDTIREEFQEGYPELLETMGELRPHVHNAFPEYEKRKSVFEQFIRTEITRLKERNAQKRLASAAIDRKGKVFLIGAGPGDPDLITVKGQRALSKADVVVYDSLVSIGLIERLPAETEKIHVGKRAGTPCIKQEEINALLIKKACEGATVVRLKGGDPFVFGRGAEEVEALAGAGISVEVIPGITAGTGIPATLGIPLTHRKMSSSVVFATGHEDTAKGRNRTDWSKLSSADTIVVYMGIGRLGALVAEWRSAGIPSSRPVAVIFGGTLPEETVVFGTMDTIVGRVSSYSGNLPGLIVVGETVRFLRGAADCIKAIELLEQQ